MVTLATSVEDILDAMVDQVEAETATGGSLEDAKSVVRGDRVRPMPKLPAIWLVPEPAANTHEHSALRESWTMPVRIAALVKDDDPDSGGRLAVRLAAAARAAVLAERRLGLAYVNDVVSTAFDAAAQRSERNRTLLWSEATVTVHWWTEGA